MISFNFAYYKPTSISETVRTFQNLHDQGMDPIYYNGGTEIITMARLNAISTRAVIDIKGIPECQVQEFQNQHLVIGASVSLTQVAEANLFPFLGEACRKIADHTSRNKITLGGNINGMIPYREAVLPLLLTDTHVMLAGMNGFRTLPIQNAFRQTLQLEPGEFLVQVRTARGDTELPFVYMKKTRMEKVDYPLVTLAAVKKENRIRVALSGVCAFPFRSPEMEDVLNDQSLAREERVRQALQRIPAPLVHDIHGSAGYRSFVLFHALVDTLIQLEGVSL